MPIQLQLLRPGRAILLACAAFFALAMCTELADAAAVVDVYRMIQYDIGGAPFGCRKSGFNLYAAAGSGNLPAEDLVRAIVVMRARDANFTLLSDVVRGRTLVGGLLLLLPRSYSHDKDGSSDDDSDAAEAAEVRAKVAQIEQLLLNATVSAPVLFAVEDDELAAMVEDVRVAEEEGKPASATNGGHKLVVSLSEARKLRPTTLFNFEAWLHGQAASDARGSASGGSSSSSSSAAAAAASLPTVAIVASYDTFGVAPALSSGANSGASGVVALLELLRLFSRLYASPRTRPPFNIVFLLAAGGPFNYEGTRQWLSGMDQSMLEGIDFAVCLSALGGTTPDLLVDAESSSPLSSPSPSPSSSAPLHLHVSKPLRNPGVQTLLASLQNALSTSTAAESSSSNGAAAVDAVHKKINVSDPRVPWPHELFSRYKVLAGTLSSLPSAPSRLFQATGGIADTRRAVDDKLVLDAIKAVAETVAAHIYGIGVGSTVNASAPTVAAPTPTPENGDPSSSNEQQQQQSQKPGSSGSVEFFARGMGLAVNEHFVRHWLDYLSENPRVPPFLSADTPIVTALQQELSAHAHRVERKHASLPHVYSFYGNPTAKLYIYQVASVTFDLVTMLVVALYLSSLFVILHIATKGLDDFIGVFRKPPPRKAKAA